MQDHLVAVLAYDGLCTFEFGCAVEVFGLPRPELEIDWYRFAVCALDDGPMRSAGGVTLSASHGLATLSRAQTIIIPGWRGADAEVPQALIDALRAAHARGARIASICSGVFVLAAGGLLDGRRATTHWRYAPMLAERFPAVSVDPKVLYIDEGDVITSAGSAAGIDMMLHLVRRDHGSRVCNMVARRLVMPPHREGGQAQFVLRPVPKVENSRFATVVEHLRLHAAQDHSIADLASMAAMSPRSFFRRFREAVGMSPYEWLTHERVAIAKEMLEESRLPVEQIAERSGFAAPETLRHHFRRIVGRSPSDYRRLYSATGSEVPGVSEVPRDGPGMRRTR